MFQLIRNIVLKAIKIFVWLLFIQTVILVGQPKPGITVGILGGRVNLLNVQGYQYGTRIGYWPLSWLNFGIESSTGYQVQDKRGSGYTATADFMRIHAFGSLHARFFPYVHPYIIGSIGKDMVIENPQSDYHIDVSDLEEEYSFVVSTGMALRVGLAAEFGPYLVTFETGGGTMGTGHVSTNITMSYALKSLPQYTPFSDFTVIAGIHHFYPFNGPYSSQFEDGGFDITVVRKNTKKYLQEYNAGIFFTQGPIFHTGVFNLGIGWQLPYQNGFWRYFTITPGIQMLIWAEGDPDFILPAASLGLNGEIHLWKFVGFSKVRGLLTYSNTNEILSGFTYTFGIGFDF